jgi:hypothetical protein
MTAPTTSSIPGTARRRLGGLLGNDWFAATAAAAVAVAGSWLLVPGEPGRVDLAIDNPTDHDISVAARGGDDDGWQPIATLEASSARSIEDVYDHGGRWVFRLSGRGRGVLDLTVSRADLEAAGWSLEVPVRLNQQLTDPEATAPGALR